MNLMKDMTTYDSGLYVVAGVAGDLACFAERFAEQAKQDKKTVVRLSAESADFQKELNDAWSGGLFCRNSQQVMRVILIDAAELLYIAPKRRHKKARLIEERHLREELRMRKRCAKELKRCVICLYRTECAPQVWEDFPALVTDYVDSVYSLADGADAPVKLVKTMPRQSCKVMCDVIDLWEGVVEDWQLKILRSDGKLVFPPEDLHFSEWVRDIRCDIAPAPFQTERGKWGYADLRTGRVTTEPVWDFASFYEQGFGKVWLGCEPIAIENAAQTSPYGGHYGLVDEDGDMVEMPFIPNHVPTDMELRELWAKEEEWKKRK